jgi:hypothetical protein
MKKDFFFCFLAMLTNELIKVLRAHFVSFPDTATGEQPGGCGVEG